MSNPLAMALLAVVCLGSNSAELRATEREGIETVTRDVFLEPGIETVSIESFTGAITLEPGSRVSGDVRTEFGEVRLERGAEVGGSLENETGAITLAAARVLGGISTTGGDIEIGADSHVEGGILVRERGVIGLSLGPLKVGFPLGRETPRVIIGPGATVSGTLRFEREVELYVSERATIGAVEGATPVRFAGERPDGSDAHLRLE
jgi:hypothetical protein